MKIAVSQAYDFVLPLRVFRHDSFEPLLVVVCFFVDLGFWWIMDACRSSASAPARSWKFNGVHFRQELFWYLGPLLCLDFIFPRREARLLAAVAAPTTARLFGDVVLSLFLYDLLFTVSHLALHSKTLYGRVHAKHHTHAHVTALDSIRLTFAEELTDVLCSVFALHLTGAHQFSRAVYNIVIVWCIVELHAGYDLP